MAAPAPPAPAPAAAPPCTPKLLKHDVDAGFDLTFTCDLEFDITATNFKDVDLPLEGFPLKGAWTCSVNRQDEDGKSETAVCVDYGSRLKVGALGQKVDVEMELRAVAGDQSWYLADSFWRRCPAPDRMDDDPSCTYSGFTLTISQDEIDAAKDASKGVYNPATHRHYRLRFEMQRTKLSPSFEARELAVLLPDLDGSPTPFDIRLFFPNAHDNGAELWSTSGFLTGASHYFRTLLRSGFCETVTHSKKRPRTHADTPASTAPIVADSPRRDFEDSDDETDKVFFDNKAPVLHDHDGDCPLEYKQITITKTAFTTYRAVLMYLRTHCIFFAPLSSACKPTNSAATRSRREQIDDLFIDESICPVSPKSAYRLAHLLELETLQDLCLANLRKNLSVEIAPVELVDDASICFDAWRKVIVEWIFENWVEVSKSDGWKELQEKLKRDEVPGAGPIMVEFMGKFAPKQEKS